MTCIFHSFLMFHRLNNELLVLVAGLKTALHLSSPPRFQGIPEEMSSKTAPPLQFAHTLTHTHSCNSRAGTLTDTYTHFPHLSFSHFFSSLPPPLFSLSLNAPLPLHPPPLLPPPFSGPSLVSMATVGRHYCWLRTAPGFLSEWRQQRHCSVRCSEWCGDQDGAGAARL